MLGVDVFRPIQPTDYPVLHTVVTCDLEPDFSCHAQGVLGPYGRSFYVSKNAIYLWVHESWGSGATDAKQAPAVVYRFPTRGGDPGAMRVWGGPVDQFSFKEDKGTYLNRCDIFERSITGNNEFAPFGCLFCIVRTNRPAGSGDCQQENR